MAYFIYNQTQHVEQICTVPPLYASFKIQVIMTYEHYTYPALIKQSPQMYRQLVSLHFRNEYVHLF